MDNTKFGHFDAYYFGCVFFFPPAYSGGRAMKQTSQRPVLPSAGPQSALGVST